MSLGSITRRPLVQLVAVAVLPLLALGCKSRQSVEANDLVASFAVNRTRAPLGSAIEVTYTWTAGPGFKKIADDHRAFVHFLDSHQVVLFDDDHVPQPAPSTWVPGQTYTYSRTVFIPIYPYVGDVQVVMGLYPTSGRGERVALKGEDIGMRAYKTAQMELLPQTENIFLVYKEGWHGPESSPHHPTLERTWTKKDALVSFKNPKEDVVVYLEANTSFKAFAQPPVLTVSLGGGAGAVVPLDSSDVFLKKIRFKAADLGTDEWVDLKLSLNESFVPKAKGINQDDRELGILVYHLYIGEAERLGALQPTTVVDASPLASVRSAAVPGRVSGVGAVTAPATKKS
jgi:hypothetical protein